MKWNVRYALLLFISDLIVLIEGFEMCEHMDLFDFLLLFSSVCPMSIILDLFYFSIHFEPLLGHGTESLCRVHSFIGGGAEIQSDFFLVVFRRQTSTVVGIAFNLVFAWVCGCVCVQFSIVCSDCIYSSVPIVIICPFLLLFFIFKLQHTSTSILCEAI